MAIEARFMVSLSGKEFILYGGLLDCAHRAGLVGIETDLVQIPTAQNDFTAIVKARVKMDHTGDGPVRVYEAYADASPKNVGPKIATALLRMCETRAKARALRDATNVGEPLFDDPEEAGDGRFAPSVREVPIPLTLGAGRKTPDNGSAPAPDACAECGVALSPGQAKVSRTRYIRPLCPRHQAEAKEAAK